MTSSKPDVIPQLPVQGWFARIVTGARSLLTGMGVTFKYFSHPSTVVTQQYPENRDTLKLPERVRAQLELIHDQNGFHKCTACHICEQSCPNASIHVLERSNPALSKVELDTFIWRLDSCTFCNLCVMVCPFQTLAMKPNFESSVYDQRLLIYNLSKYAGASATALAKVPEKLADPEERKKLVEPRTPFDGPTALNGFALAGLPPRLQPTEHPHA